MKEQRNYSRIQPHIKGMEIGFLTQGSDGCKARVQDISQSGVFLWECFTENDDVTLTFQIGTKKPFVVEGIVVRKDSKDPWIVIQFKQPLSEFDLKRIQYGDNLLYLPGDQSTYNLASIDRAEVFRESNQIKTCSSNYFMWCIGCIVPFTIAIWALVLAGKLNAESASSSMVGIIIIFSAAVFSNIEKSRAINKREGFIAALDYYLCHNKGPLNYRGWVNLKHCMGECRARIKAGICPVNVQQIEKPTCIQVGKNRSKAIRTKKSILPAILDSFVSLTSFFYALVFSGLSILTLISFSETWHMLYAIPVKTTSIWFILGFALSVIILKNFYLLIGILIAVIVTIAGGAIFTAQFLINISTIGIGAILGAIGCFFFKQLLELRKGNYSFEAYTHAWFEIFENCIFLPDEASEKPPSESMITKIRNKITQIMPSAKAS